MHRTTGPGRLRVKWWNDSGNTYVRPTYNDSKAGPRYGHNWHTKVFVFWVVFMGAVSLSVYFAMRFDMLERRRENLANMCEGRARMLEVQCILRLLPRPSQPLFSCFMSVLGFIIS